MSVKTRKAKARRKPQLPSAGQSEIDAVVSVWGTAVAVLWELQTRLLGIAAAAEREDRLAAVLAPKEAIALAHAVEECWSIVNANPPRLLGLPTVPTKGPGVPVPFQTPTQEPDR
jgi:hypothetical protein